MSDPIRRAMGAFKSLFPAKDREMDDDIIQKEESRVWQMAPDVLAKSLSFEIEKGQPDLDYLLPVQQELRAEIAAQQWLSVSDIIEEIDENRTRLPSGRHFLSALLEGLWNTSLAEALPDYDFSDGVVLNAGDLPDSHIADYIAAAKAHPDAMGLRCLTAYMHLQMAWARRGKGSVDFADEAAFQAFETHIKAAWELVRTIKAKEVDSPLVAEIIYCCGAAGGAKGLEDLEAKHEEWVALDPMNMSAFSTHGQFLLPRWYGSYETLDNRARLSHETHRASSGMASYAACYLEAVERDPVAVSGVDMLQFQDGLLDMLTHAANPEVAINVICARLYHICSLNVSGYDTDTGDIILSKIAELETILQKFIRQGLGTVYPAVWTPYLTELEVPYVLAEAFESEIMAGYHVHLNEDGAKITPPERAKQNA